MAEIFTWPVAGEQRITTAYDASTGSIRIQAAQGAEVRAITGGTVSVVADDRLQISSAQFAVTCTGLQDIRVQPGDTVERGESVASAGAAGSVTVMIYQTIDPTEMFEREVAPVGERPDEPTETPVEPEPEAPEPTPVEIGAVVYVTPTTEGLRVREQPINGKPVGQLKLGEVVESLETADVTEGKLGVNGQWLHIRRSDGTEAYTAAWFLQKAAAPSEPGVEAPASKSLLGMNLDIHHPQGHPDPQAMTGIGWVRLKFNVSYNPETNSYGNRDIEAAYRRYLPHIERYAKSGMKVLMVFTHQLYGEGAGFNWTQMDGGRWRQLVPVYADFAKQVAAKFAGTNLVHGYQIWNEQDTRPENARAAVPVPAKDYGYMLTETIRAIRAADQKTPVITGGHTTGPQAGSQYAREALATMPADVRPDGIALHPYGRGQRGQRFSIFGSLSESIDRYSAVLPGKPVWITEWGVLDHQGRADVVGDVFDYAEGFMNIVKNTYPGKVATCIWYAWADGMDNGFGLVDSNGKPKPNFNARWRTLG